MASRLSQRLFTRKESSPEIYNKTKSEGIYEELDRQLKGSLENHYSRIEDIYDELTSYRQTQSVARKANNPLVNAIGELVDTEDSYIFALKRIRDGFMFPLTTFLSPQQRSLLFMNLEDVIGVHTKFYEDLWSACYGDTAPGGEAEAEGGGGDATVTTTTNDPVVADEQEAAGTEETGRGTVRQTSVVDEGSSVVEGEAPADVAVVVEEERASVVSVMSSFNMPTDCIQKLSEVIVKHADTFAEVHALYTSRIPYAVREIQRILGSTDEARDRILTLSKEQPDSRSMFEDRIRTPPRRLMKLPLLIKALIKALTKGFEDHEDLLAGLTAAERAIEAVIRYIDLVHSESSEFMAGSTLKRHLTYNRTKDVGGALSIQYRLLEKGDLMVAIGDSNPRMMSVFLLGDVMLLCCPTSEGGFDCFRAVPLVHMQLDHEKESPAWKLKDTLTGEEFSFLCTDEHVKVVKPSWIEATAKAITMSQSLAQPSFLRKMGHWLLTTACGPGAKCTLGKCGNYCGGVTGKALECMLCRKRCHPACADDMVDYCAEKEPTTLKCSLSLPDDIMPKIQSKIWFESKVTDRDKILDMMMNPEVPNGSFLARFSSSSSMENSIVFSIKDSETVKHLRLFTIAYRPTGNKSMIAFCLTDTIGFYSVDDLVAWCQTHPLQVKRGDTVQFKLPFRTTIKDSILEEKYPKASSGLVGEDMYIGGFTGRGDDLWGKFMPSPFRRAIFSKSHSSSRKESSDSNNSMSSSGFRRDSSASSMSPLSLEEFFPE